MDTFGLRDKESIDQYNSWNHCFERKCMLNYRKWGSMQGLIIEREPPAIMTV